MALDTTRPISTDGDSADLAHDNYTVFCHYEGDTGQFAVGQYTENVCDVPGKPNGQGEFIWYNDHTAQGMTWFATASLRMREKGAEDTRPYTLLSDWSSVIPGVKRTDFSSLETGYPERAAAAVRGGQPARPVEQPADPAPPEGLQPRRRRRHRVLGRRTSSRTQPVSGRWPRRSSPPARTRGP